MLQMIENTLAAIIILVLLGVVMYLAFDGREIGLQPQTDQQRQRVEQQQQQREQQQRAKRQTTQPDTATQDSEPKRQARSSEDAQTRRTREQATTPTERVQPKIQDQLPKTRRPDVLAEDMGGETVVAREEARLPREPRQSVHPRMSRKDRHVRDVRYRDPWRRTDYYECSDGWCDCSCDRPYWSRSGPCWD